MNYLAIDCTSNSLCVIARKDKKLATRFIENSQLQHSVLCMSLVEEVLTTLNLSIESCDFLCGVTGPGSFTGIRVGLSTILGFAVAAKKNKIGVTSYQMLSYDKLERFLAVIDAGKNHFYVCGYDNGKVILPPAHITLAKLEELSKEYILYSFMPLPVPHKLCNKINCLEGAIQQAIQENFVNYPLRPFYVKKSQAEENLQNRGK